MPIRSLNSERFRPRWSGMIMMRISRCSNLLFQIRDLRLLTDHAFRIRPSSPLEDWLGISNVAYFTHHHDKDEMTLMKFTSQSEMHPKAPDQRAWPDSKLFINSIQQANHTVYHHLARQRTTSLPIWQWTYLDLCFLQTSLRSMIWSLKHRFNGWNF
jgi:hypothetical protein